MTTRMPCDGSPHTCGLTRPPDEPVTPSLDTWNICHGLLLSQFYQSLVDDGYIDEDGTGYRSADKMAATYLEISYKDVQRESNELAEWIGAVLRWNHVHSSDELRIV